MKKTTALFIAAIALLSACGNSGKNGNATVSGTLSNYGGETLILERMSPQGYIFIDSTKADEAGNFSFANGGPGQMDFYRIKISEANFAVIVADSTQKLTVKADAKSLGKNYSVEGSPDTKQFIELNTILQASNNSLDSLKAKLNEAMMSTRMDSLKMDSLNNIAEAAYMGIIERSSPALIKKVEEFPASIANFSAFNNINIEKNLSTYEKVEKGLTEKYPASLYAQQLKKNIDMYKQQFELQEAQNKVLPNNAPMPEIRLNDVNGKPIALSSLKGKVVLVDFWASWCGPCRKENPNVVRLYNQYHKKGFDIYSVSLDDDKEKWERAIQKDGLTWNHVSDLKGWYSPVCKQFNINSIPFTILVDKAGNIIAKGLRGGALEEKLQQLLGK